MLSSRRWGGQWSKPEIAFVTRFGLVPFHPKGAEWQVPKEEFNFLHDTMPERRHPKSQFELFCIWCGIPVETVKHPVWKLCAKQRIEGAERPAIELLTPGTLRRIKSAADRAMSEMSNKPLQIALGGLVFEGFSLLVAYEYAIAIAKGKIDASHPLRQPLSKPDFWTLLANHHAILRHPVVLNLLGAPDASADNLVLRVLHASESRIGISKEPGIRSLQRRIPDQIADGSLSLKEFMLVDDYDAIASLYARELGIPTGYFIAVRDVWIRASLDEQEPEFPFEQNAFVEISEQLEQLEPHTFGYFCHQVSQFRRRIVKPYLKAKSTTELPNAGAIELNTFEAALERIPLLNCVLHASIQYELNQKSQKKSGPRRQHAKNRTCAFAKGLFDKMLKNGTIRRNRRPVSKMLGHLSPSLSDCVQNSIPPSASGARGKYALLAPLLAALFRTTITPKKVEGAARHYANRGPGYQLMEMVVDYWDHNRFITPTDSEP